MQRRWMAACVAVTTLALAACGGGGGGGSASGGGASGSSASGGADKGLPAALASVGRQGRQTITLSLFGDVTQFSKLGGSGASGASHRSAADAKTTATLEKILPTSSMALNIEPGSAGTGRFEMAVSLPGAAKAVDLIAANQTLYLRVDVNGIGAATGANTSKLTSQAAAIETALPFVGPLLAGNFVSLDLKSLQGLAKSFGVGTGASGVSGASGSVPPNAKGMIDALRAALIDNTQITDAGTDRVGHRYKVVAQPQQLLTALYAQASKLAGPLASQLSKAQANLNKVSDKPVTVDAWTSGGHLKQLQLDFRQFGPPAETAGAAPVGLQIAFGPESGSITVPTNATPVDLSKLGSLFGGLIGGSAKTSTRPTA